MIWVWLYLTALTSFVAGWGIASRLRGASVAADYEHVLSDHRRLVRELDVALNGEAGAASQASLCDLVAQVQQWRREAKYLTDTQSLWAAIYNRSGERSA